MTYPGYPDVDYEYFDTRAEAREWVVRLKRMQKEDELDRLTYEGEIDGAGYIGLLWANEQVEKRARPKKKHGGHVDTSMKKKGEHYTSILSRNNESTDICPCCAAHCSA